jgi:hypothetical protein
MASFRFLFALTLILSAFKSNAQTITNEECMKFHTGTFVDGSMSEITIVRDSAFQVETNTKTNKSSTYSITWINSCTYVLKFVKSEDKADRKAAKAMGDLTVRIVSYDADGYSYIATAPNMQGAIRGSVKWKK